MTITKIALVALACLVAAGCARNRTVEYNGQAYAAAPGYRAERQGNNDCDGRLVKLKSGRTWCVLRTTDEEVLSQPEYRRKRSDVCGDRTSGVVEVRLAHGQVAGYDCGAGRQ